ncbi:MAG: hypothetical protein A3E25_13635 [Burkholderiales bacterium RIFCSPHIGHO2_12_FULL_69_20]|nr:MAG: hypothetical protein A3E25_13635 [Burkholderiales bacterium RIFCSPHIGHO2_12_FULL_69_20]
MSNPISPDKMAALIEVRDLFPGLDSKSQCSRVLEFLQRGFMLSTFEGSRHLDVYHCPARILQLRAAGHNIITHWVTVETESGNPHRVGNYLLMRGEVQHAA